MNFLPLSLGIARPVKGPGGSKGDKGGTGQTGSVSALARKIPSEIKTRIFERDDYACRFCGFKSKKYQEVHFLNQDPQDMADKNMATSCIFCHQCFDLEEVSQMKSGVLLWLPEIDQARLHHIARAIYVARVSQGPMADAARKALDALMARRDEAKARISTDNPYILAMVLRDYLTPKHYAERVKKLEGIKLFPLDRRIIQEADLQFNQFPQILAYWRSKDGPFGGRAPTQWIAAYQDIVAKVA